MTSYDPAWLVCLPATTSYDLAHFGHHLTMTFSDLVASRHPPTTTSSDLVASGAFFGIEFLRSMFMPFVIVFYDYHYTILFIPLRIL